MEQIFRIILSLFALATLGIIIVLGIKDLIDYIKKLYK